MAARPMSYEGLARSLVARGLASPAIVKDGSRRNGETP